jgi:hypothetical protein
VAQFSRCATGPRVEPIIQNQSTADAGANVYTGHLAYSPAPAGPMFAQTNQVHVILDRYGDPELRLQVGPKAKPFQ